MKRALAALWRFLFTREERLSEEWLLDMRKAEGAEEFAREMDDSRIVRAPSVVDGPPTKALSRVQVR
jgi:hypothetical protein